MNALVQLGLFTAKAAILILMITLLFVIILAIVSRAKEALKGRIIIKNINEKYNETKTQLLEIILSKKLFKKFIKQNNAQEKEKLKAAIETPAKNIFVLNFHGDIKASAVSALREEVTAILSVATPRDEVLVTVESGGGMVHAYGLAAAQLERIRQKNIPLIVAIDKIAASGGYMMACVANKIIAAPFAIIGSIGVIVQLPNFHKLLKEKHIDFEQLTAGNYKRTLTLFGKNTEEGREKLQQEIEEIHHLFKNLIHDHRPQLNIEKIATGEHWLGKQALELNLVDEIMTSDDYLQQKTESANIYEIDYFVKKSFGEKLGQAAQMFKQTLLGNFI